MKPSLLQLKRYFVSEINLSVNKDFNPGEDVKLDFEDLIVLPEFIRSKSNTRQWEVSLRVQFQQIGRASCRERV